MNTSSKNYNRRAGTPSLIAGLSLAVVAAIVALIVSYQTNKSPEQKPAVQNSSPQTVISSTSEENDKSEEESSEIEEIKRTGLEIRYIDVGQGESTLVMLPDGKNLLIDAGSAEYGEKVVGYLENENIEKIDYLIATNLNEDNIGGLAEVIENFDIGRVYAQDMEDIVEKNKDDSKTISAYNNFNKALSAKKLKTLSGKGGTHVYFSLSLTIDIIAPNDYHYSEMNNYSIAVKIKYGQQNFIFMGDAENYSEQEILDGDYDIASDVIRIGNHGSSVSSGKTFIGEVKPKYAVISCGKDNKEGYPHKETLKTLEENEVKVYRTDLNGTITLKSDGMNELKITSEKEEKPSYENSDKVTGESSDRLSGESTENSESGSENSVTASDEVSGIESNQETAESTEE